MKSIGGYFELELNSGSEFHKKSLRLNTGRNALAYILENRKIKKIYLPDFICDAVIHVVKKADVLFDFYNIDSNFEPVFDTGKIQQNEVFLYVNYFGLKGRYALELSKKFPNFILDNSQAFFEPVIPGVDTFYSARKFIGVTDGAYLYTDLDLKNDLEPDISYARMEYSLRRLDVSAEDGYPFFKQAENLLNDQQIKLMSKLTYSILDSVNYESIIKIRRDNFTYLSNRLDSINKLSFTLEENAVPMTYPFYPVSNNNLRGKLTSQKVYTATYWPNIIDLNIQDSIAYEYAKNIIHLPIDQRITKKDLDSITNIINS